MTTINPTYIQIVKPVVAARATVFPVAVGRNISQAQDTAEQTAAIIEREVGRLLQLALAAAQLPGVTPAGGSVYAQAAPSAAANATAVRTELATELARVDVAISSRLATAGYTAPENAPVPTASDNAAEVLAATIEGDMTMQGVLRIMLAVTAGDATGLEGSSAAFKSVDGTKDRVLANYESGNRNVIAIDPT